jgi:hypothetical protein
MPKPPPITGEPKTWGYRAAPQDLLEQEVDR